jgi:hypothetical protein
MVAQKIEPKKEPVSQKPEKPKKEEKTNQTKPAPQSVWSICINKYGDLHLRKAMLDSLKVLSKIEPGQPLTMTFKPGAISVVAETKQA